MPAPVYIDQTVSQNVVTYRIVPGHPTYRVGTDGSVWTCRKKGRKVSSKHEFEDAINRTWVLLKPYKDVGGYVIVTMQTNGKPRAYKAHRLVLMTFVGPCPEGEEGCHNNGIRDDNRLSNLRWDTRRSNSADRVKHGTDNRGEKNALNKLTEQDVITMREKYSTGLISLAGLAAEYRVTRSAVFHVVSRRTWKHL